MSEPTIRFKRTPEDLPGGKPICDLCAADDPIMAFPASGFLVTLVTDEGTYTQDYNNDGWAACAWCSPLVEAGDLERLIQRYLVIHCTILELPSDAQQFVRGLIRLQHEQFLKHRTGPGVPLTEAPR
jgi:hypothetical protein